MKHFAVIKKAILSEKAYKLMESGLYTFLVDERSTKQQIAKAVKDQFEVKVKKVNVMNKSSKMKRIQRTRKETEVGGGKKAVVYLVAGQKIAALSPKAEAGKSNSKKSMKDKDVQTVVAEGKEA